MPTVLSRVGEPDRLVYTGYWKGRFDLYEHEADEPFEVTQLDPAPEPASPDEIVRFEPDILVTIDESAKEDRKGFKLFLEDAGANFGVDSNQTFIGQIYFQWSDFFGDRRLYASAASIESFQNFNVTFVNLAHRWQWSLSLFDNEQFFIGQNFETGRIERIQSLFRQTGVMASTTYPISFYRRLDFSAGFISRDIDYQDFARDSDFDLILDDDGNPIPIIVPRKDEYPQVGLAYVSDTTLFGPVGPAGGHRFRFDAIYAPDLDDTGPDTALHSNLQLEARKYFPITRRSSFALRAFGTVRDGNFPNPVYLGGLDTIRGFEFRDLVGDRAFFTNIELRFPLIDLFATPVISFQGIQGRFFLDIGGVWFDDVQEFDFWDSENSRLDDAVAAYGFGISVRFFGLNMHWDYAIPYDFKESGDAETTFWIGQRF